MKNYNSFKQEKTPEKRIPDIAKYDKISSNIKNKKTDSNINTNKTTAPLIGIPMHYSSKTKQISPKVELTLNSTKLDPKKVNYESKHETEKSTLVPLTSETNE